jgi:hypothetical protein
MAKNSVAQFFATVYNDKSLQGALHFALAKSAPNVVVEIAKKKGFEFSSDEAELGPSPAAARPASCRRRSWPAPWAECPSPPLS